MRLHVAWSAYWRRLQGDRQDPHYWVDLLWLSYLAFLFIPLAYSIPDLRWLWATLISLPVFLLLFFAHDRATQMAHVWQPVGMAALGLALVPFNPYGNTYIIFAAVFAPLAVSGLLRPALLAAAFIAAYAIEVTLIGNGKYVLPITVLVAGISCVATYFSRENRRKNIALRKSQDEVRHLAQIAERERIGRDLHDLLGHTLSLIALKADLAGRLLTRDPRAAGSEIEDVQRIAREALRQVRTAVSGIRDVGLQGEMTSARAILESSNVTATFRQKSVRPLPPEIEIALAMTLREAATNIHRHAQARHAEIDLNMDRDAVSLSVADDGKGGIVSHGNGLSGIAERIRSLGGSLEVESPDGRGTTLKAQFPLQASS